MNESRCTATMGSLRCQSNGDNRCSHCGRADTHDGPHWADVGIPTGLRYWWTSDPASSWKGCIDWPCNRPPGHELPHRNGRGLSWWPVDEQDEAAGWTPPGGTE